LRAVEGHLSMEPLDYDVYLSYREESGGDLARLVATGLAGRGFRVFDGGRRTDVGAGREDILKTIEDIPDFVLLLTPGCLDACADQRDPMRADIVQALQTQRNLVPVAVHEYEHPATLPRDLARLRARPTVAYNRSRSNESVARIAHRLSSDATVDERHMMHGAKRMFVGAGLILLVVLATIAIRTLPGMIARYRASRPLAPMVLYWSAFGQRPVAGGWVEFPVRDRSPMLAGDQFRLAFSPSADGYAYAVVKDLRGNISMLFPPRALKGGSRVRAGQLYSAPADGSWWTPDEGVGVDRLYVFVSYDSIENLESLTDEREESSAERQALLDSTIDGLLDGSHGLTPLRVRTRAGRRVLGSLDVRPTTLTASVTLGGARVTHPLVSERGLLSAMIEMRVGPAR